MSESRQQQKGNVPDLKLDAGLPANVDAEKTILGAVLLDNNAHTEAAEFLDASDFSLDSHQRIFLRMSELMSARRAVDIVTLSNELTRYKEIEAVGGVAYLASLTEHLPLRPVIKEYIRIVKDKSLLRQLMASCSSAIARAADQSDTALDVGLLLESQVQTILAAGVSSSLERLSAYFMREFPTPESLLEETAQMRGLATGFSGFDEMTCGLQKQELIIIAARPSMGKAQGLNEPILLRSGEWRKMGDISVGDELASIDGRSSRVLAVHERGQLEMFRVTFSDGRSTSCAADHLWRVYYRAWKQPRVIDTLTLSQMLNRKRYKGRLWIDLISGRFGDSSPSFDPYVLGVLLGDGDLTGNSPRVTTADRQILDELRARLGRSVAIVRQGTSITYGLIQKAPASPRWLLDERGRMWIDYWLTRHLAALGLVGKCAEEKFIPEPYFQSNREDRLWLLQGLLDTDGWIEKHGTVRFASSSERLASDFQRLVRSLGGYCTIKPKATKRLTSYVCTVSFTRFEDYFCLDKKRQRLGRNSRCARLTFESIRSSEPEQCRCISVSHPSNLYVTRDYIVTHNSALAWNIAEHIGINCESKVAIFSLEMSKESFLRRAICSRARIPLQDHRTGRMRGSQSMMDRQADAYRELVKSDIHIDDRPKTALGLAADIRALKMKNDLDLAIIDYLGLFKHDDSQRRFRSPVAEVGLDCLIIKDLAKELKIPIVLLCQLSRELTKRQDKRPILADLRDSGNIEEHADLVSFVHREGYYEKNDEKLANKAEWIIAKNRNGPTGTIDLHWEPTYTRFSNPDEAGDAQFEFTDWYGRQ